MRGEDRGESRAPWDNPLYISDLSVDRIGLQVWKWTGYLSDQQKELKDYVDSQARLAFVYTYILSLLFCRCYVAARQSLHHPTFLTSNLISTSSYLPQTSPVYHSSYKNTPRNRWRWPASCASTTRDRMFGRICFSINRHQVTTTTVTIWRRAAQSGWHLWCLS